MHYVAFCSAVRPIKPGSALLARLDVQNLVRETGLVEDHDDLEDEPFHEIEPEMAEANGEADAVVTDKADPPEETNKRAVTLVPGLPAG